MARSYPGWQGELMRATAGVHHGSDAPGRRATSGRARDTEPMAVEIRWICTKSTRTAFLGSTPRNLCGCETVLQPLLKQESQPQTSSQPTPPHTPHTPPS